LHNLTPAAEYVPCGDALHAARRVSQSDVTRQRLDESFVNLAVDERLRTLIVDETCIAFTHTDIGLTNLLKGQGWDWLRCGIH
tara:strand:- start:1918 stop:2166 length:249 start_codon:yes stop_codon:yes gene_type:complete